MNTNKPPWHDRPGVWFGLLWQALQEQDFAKAAEAQENLERLGVEVWFRKLPANGDLHPERQVAHA